MSSDISRDTGNGIRADDTSDLVWYVLRHGDVIQVKRCSVQL